MRNLAIVGYGKMGKLIEQLAPEYDFQVALKLDEFNNADGAGAGAEGGRGFDVGLEDVEEAVAVEELEHGSGLAAGHDEAVELGKFEWSADEPGLGAEGDEGLHVRVVGSLKGKDAYGEWLLR